MSMINFMLTWLMIVTIRFANNTPLWIQIVELVFICGLYIAELLIESDRVKEIKELKKEIEELKNKEK